VHEFGHSFGELCDEYLTTNSPVNVAENKIECPNCTTQHSGNPNTPCEKWQNIPNTGCYAGCFAPDLYRPAKTSIMGPELENNPNSFEFNEVSKEALEKKLEQFE
jgi:hypothetical protein